MFLNMSTSYLSLPRLVVAMLVSSQLPAVLSGVALQGFQQHSPYCSGGGGGGGSTIRRRGEVAGLRVGAGVGIEAGTEQRVGVVGSVVES